MSQNIFSNLNKYNQSQRLAHIRYDIRGPIFDKATELEAAGHKIIRLNIGNPAPFGFDAPQTVVDAMANNLRRSQGYSHHLGIMSARQAVVEYAKKQCIEGVTTDHVFIGNGVSELILMTMQAIIDAGDEILVPSPDYPLWTAAVGLSGGTAVHYLCDEQADWYPDIADMKSKITPKTKGIVIINPNNPTGAVYPSEIVRSIVELAAEHKLIVFSDEIYDKVLYDDNVHYPTATFDNKVLVLTYGGISKNCMAAGFRGGWLIVSGPVSEAKRILEGLNLLASLRLCANVPTQQAIAVALSDDSQIKSLTSSTGRLSIQRDLIYDMITQIPGVSCIKPKGALYLFPKIDLSRFSFDDDEEFAFDLLSKQHVLIVAGKGFNYLYKDHFRIVFLPNETLLSDAGVRIGAYLDGRRV